MKKSYILFIVVRETQVTD